MTTYTIIKNILTVLVVFILSLVLIPSSYACNEGELVPYKRILRNPYARYDGDMLKEDAQAPSPGHIQRVVFVLKHYSERFVIENSKLLIDCKLWKDKDLLSNFSSKAEDIDWLLQVGFEFKPSQSPKP